MDVSPDAGAPRLLSGSDPVFCVLGPLEVRGTDGRRVVVPRGRERALLAALCAHAGQVVSVDRLVDLVWADARPDHPENAVQARISALRRRLGADRMVTAERGYELVVGRTQLDAWILEDLVEEASRSAAGDPTMAERRCAEALAYWRGDPLPELDDAALVPLITRWSELRRHAITLRVLCLLELGRAAEAAVVATAAFDEDPLDEGIARAAMSSLHRAGRQADALRFGQRHRSALAAAGLEVGPAFLTAEREVLDDAGGIARVGRVPPPFYGDRFIGADMQREAAVRATESHRLTTLVGPGGVGKTRLAREVALTRPGWWCEAGVTPGDADLADLAAVVCAEMRIRPSQGAPAIDALRDALRDEEGLLVLDECDRCGPAAAAMIARLLASAPRVNVLVSSRSSLGVAGEHVIEVPSLPTGPGSPAADLLVDRARGVTALTDADGSVVGEIVGRLDGLPLAVELAAARLAVLGPDELLTHLDRGVGHLSTREPARPERHRSLVAVVDGSWSQLTAATRRTAAGLGVFRSWFTVVDAAAVTSTDPPSCAAAIDELRRSSLLQADRRHPSPRFRYLAPVRELAWSRAVAEGEDTRAQAAHLAWVAGCLQRARLHHRGRDEAASVDGVVALRPDAAAALARADPAERALVLAPLADLLAFRLTAEDAAEFDRAITRDDAADPWVIAGAAQAAFVRGDLDLVAQRCRVAEERAAAHDHVPWLVRWLDGSIPLFLGDAAASRRRLDEALADTTDPWERTFLRAAVAFAAANAGTPDAVAVASSAVDEARDLGNPSCLSWALCASGAALNATEPDTALEAYEEAVALATEVANQVTAGLARPRIAVLRARGSATLARGVAAQLADWQRLGNRSHASELIALAIPLIGTAGQHETVAELVGSVGDSAGFGLQLPGDQARIADAVAAAETALGRSRFAAARAKGARVSVDEATDAARVALERLADDV